MKEQLDRAYSLLRTGESAEALGLLESLIRENPENEDTWWLYANGVTDHEAKRNALHQVLRLSKNAERQNKAQMMLQALDQDPYSFEREVSNPARPLKPDKGFGRFVLMGIGALGLLACIGCTLFYNLRLSYSEMPETFVEIGELNAGDSLEANFDGDESHAYQLHLEAGEALRILVTPKVAEETFVLMFLYDSERNMVGNPSESGLGYSTLSPEISETGDYILIVRPFLGFGGEYTIEMESLEEAEVTEEVTDTPR